eukprot:2304773-Amphidinium_carterae.1
MGGMLGANASLGDQTNFHRLHSVCFTMYLADMKNRLETTDHDATCQVPTAERKERSEAQQNVWGMVLKFRASLNLLISCVMRSCLTGRRTVWCIDLRSSAQVVPKG